MPLFNIYGAKSKKHFHLVVKSSPDKMEYSKNYAQFKMANNVDFCRGIHIPVSASKWKCKKEKSIDVCLMKYKCSLINKSLSRLTEISKYRKKFSKHKNVDLKINYHIVGIPLLIKKKTEFKLDSKIAKKDKKIKKIDKIQIEQKDKEINKKSSKNDNKFNIDKFAENQLEKVEADYNASYKILVDKDENLPLNKNQTTWEKEEYNFNYKDPWKLLSFGLSTNYIKDKRNNSIISLEPMWSPKYNFKDRWYLLGALGIYKIKVNFVRGNRQISETFYTYNTGAYLGYRFSDKNSIALGIGLESWKSENQPDNYSYFSFRAEKRFTSPKAFKLSYLFAEFNLLNNDYKIFKMGLGFNI